MEVYLDYSATTKVDKEVLDYFNYVCDNFYANPNSNHDIGKKCNDVISSSISNICNYFNIFDDEIIFTSGASESNNTVLKGICSSGNEIITTKLEHSSIYGPCSYLQKKGYKVIFAPLDENGLVDIERLEELINDNTCLVSIGCVNSEIGFRQPIEEIGLMLKKYPNVLFHSDITQAVSKTDIDLSNVDMASFSGHKLFCFKGIGGLIKKRNVKIVPLIHGGKSTTIYRSGTPQTELICSLSKAFLLFNNDFSYVNRLNKRIREHLSKYDSILINSNDYCIDNILNISFMGKDSNVVQKYFADHGVYVSTKTACSSDTSYSLCVYEIYKDKDRASSSIRISLSYKTLDDEIDYFLSVLDKLMEEYDEIG